MNKKEINREDLKKAFEAGQKLIWEDLEQTIKTHKYQSFEEWEEETN